MTEQRKMHFDQQLLDHIKHGRNAEASSMLNQDLARGFDDRGTLLNHAAAHDNAAIARELIELGAEVDRFGGDSVNPLMLAVLNESEATLKVLLEANAKIDVVDGQSAMEVALDLLYFDTRIRDLIACRLKAETRTAEELAERLIAADCNMHHASTFRDVDLMKCMLERGVDIDSTGCTEKTALHVMVELKDIDLAEWLLNHGANADVLDEDGSSALVLSAEKGYTDMVKMLLENGANPNSEDSAYTPLYAAFGNLREGADEFLECAELLLQHGATFQNSDNAVQMFRFALEECTRDKGVELLICHLAVVEMLGDPSIDKSVMYSVDEKYRLRLSKFEKYFDQCTQVLKIVVFEELSLLDLLRANEYKMRLLLRKEKFVFEVEKVCSAHNLSELYSLYFNTVMKRIAKASRSVKLEDEAIPVICKKIFKGNYKQCCDFARRVASYLNERDLERVIQA